MKNLPTYAFSGFGGGSRSCIGKHFGMLENKVVLIKFMKRYKFDMQEKELRMKWSLMTIPQKIYTKLERRVEA